MATGLNRSSQSQIFLNDLELRIFLREDNYCINFSWNKVSLILNEESDFVIRVRFPVFRFAKNSSYSITYNLRIKSAITSDIFIQGMSIPNPRNQCNNYIYMANIRGRKNCIYTIFLIVICYYNIIFTTANIAISFTLMDITSSTFSDS